MKKIIIILLSLIIMAANSCTEYDPVESALRSSGENRPELEKVLNHYSVGPTDKLKLEAARFLIRNMPGHSSYADQVTLDYYKTIDSLYADLPFYIKQTLLCLPDYHNPPDLERKEDIHYITADFLIDHIDRMFDIWQKIPWGNDIPFDIFCEYILHTGLDVNHWKVLPI